MDTAGSEKASVPRTPNQKDLRPGRRFPRNPRFSTHPLAARCGRVSLCRDVRHTQRIEKSTHAETVGSPETRGYKIKPDEST